MKLQIIVILFLSIGIAAGIAQVSEEFVSITVTSDGKTKVSQTLFPKTFVSSIDIDLISDRISNLLAIDEKNIILGTTQNEQLLKIASLGASQVDLRYDADALSYESGVFRLKYSSDVDSKVNLPPLSKLVSLNTIPNEITDEEYSLPPGDISLSYTIRPVTSKEFSVNLDGKEQRVEAITAAKIDEFSASNEQIQFIIKDKAVILTIIPKSVLDDPNHTTLNGEDVEFSQFHQNSTHSWIRIDPHEKGLVKITDNLEKIEEGGGCLIATATFGSELAPQVQKLREIRDNQLLNSHSGTAFMTEFNQIYYSFSPTIADIQRENQIVNEIVKIAITPMISSLSLMTFAESEEEILGIGIGIILLNVGMYCVMPFWIFYFVRNNYRTRSKNNSNLLDIFSCYVRKALKTSLFGIIALLVLTVSLSSAFNQTAFADDEDPIRTILEITYQNILESREDVGEVPDTAETFFLAGQENYDEALEALENGDIVTAKEKAIVAMALFEDAAEEIGALEDQASTLLPPGFGSGIDSASDNGISNGQGLGVGGVPPGILKQITAANIFDIQEEITEIDSEIDGLRDLIESNDMDVDLTEYDESINLAKQVLANGDIPDAQAKLALANEIKSDIIDQMNAAAEESQDERVQEFVDNSIAEIESLLEKGENLGLTKKAINELEETLEVLRNGEIDEILEKTDDDSELAKELENSEDGPGNSENAPGQNQEGGPGNSENAPGQNQEGGPGNSENAPGQNQEGGPGNSENAPGQNQEGGPGNSENAPGQNNDDNEEPELPPGFGAAGDNPNENAFANGNGLGLGNIPPGLQKLFGVEDDFEEESTTDEFTDDLPPGFGAAGDNPNENAFANGNGLGLGNIPPGLLNVYSPDDYFEDAIDDLVEDDFEDKFDKMNKNSKAKEKKDMLDKLKNLPIPRGDKGGGNKNCSDKGITDGVGNSTENAGSGYTVNGITAIGNSCKDVSGNIQLRVDAPNGTQIHNGVESQPYTFTPDTNGIWIINIDVQSFSEIRGITISDGTVADAGNDDTGSVSVQYNLSGSGTGTVTSYFWEITDRPGGPPVSLTDEDTATPSFTPNRAGDWEITMTIWASNGSYDTDTVVITVS